MRKVTGYIGALIVVVALMGSVLAGYALNINGQSVVVNEYENVTDVSGLYSHTDQKTYIDYNPASNYIGYSNTATVENTFNNTNHYKKITSGHILTDYRTNAPEIYINNSPQGGMPLQPPYDVFICDYFRIYAENNGTVLTIYAYNNPTVSNIQYAEIDIDDSGITVTFSGTTTYIYPACKIALCYTTLDTWDYGVSWGTNQYTAYLTDVDQVITSTLQNPTYYNLITGNTAREEGSSGVSQVNFVTENGTHYGSIKNYTLHGDTYRSWSTFYPRSVSITDMGIDYTESNRVNNYPVSVDRETTNSVTNTTINLEQISVTDYAQPTDLYWTLGTIVTTDSSNTDHYITVTSPYTTYSNGSYHVTGGVHIYRLTDILSTISIPAGATHIYITAPYSLIQASGKYTFQGTETYSFYLPDNFLIFTDNTIVDEPDKQIFSLPNLVGGYADYNVSTGLVDVYWANGVKVNTGSPDSIYVQYCSSNSTSGNTYQYGTQQLSYTTSSRPAPYLDLTIYSSVSTTTPHYMDITKGISIKNTNVTDTIWNNGYENGQIDILFRAENPNQIYHNELTIVNNTVSINYSGGMFNVAINNGEPVNIGTWRNIILHIDLVEGKISVRPVRTFNSYSNVIMDNTSIEVGDMVGAAPTTTIVWKPTPNSFRFNIYSTSVFMNTYGVVMINPTLDITNYFPNLNRFYKLTLHNFSVYGDSITVNGETGTVTNNIVTFGEDSFIMRDLSIVYADGHAYIEDSHVSKDLGEITTTDVSMAGIWYFETDLYSGYTATKQIYTWDWESFILDNTQFCVFYIGLALVGLVAARRFCIMTVIDYAVLITSIIIALSTQVIA